VFAGLLFASLVPKGPEAAAVPSILEPCLAPPLCPDPWPRTAMVKIEPGADYVIEVYTPLNLSFEPINLPQPAPGPSQLQQRWVVDRLALPVHTGCSS